MLYEKIALAAVACALLATVTNAQRRGSHSSWTAEAREAIHHVFTGDNTLDVDDVDGTIQIIADTSPTIRVEGEKVMRAADQNALDRAKREVVLDINEKNGVAQLYVNGPFRDNGHSSADHAFHEHGDRQYEVAYNFTIHVPRELALDLRSVNGDIKTDGTGGKFNIHAVNGGIAMNSIAGSGSLNGVNGSVVVSFRESPKAASEFKTVNGRIEATFPPGLAADLSFKTLNGQTYTDFDVTSLATPPGAAAQKDGKFVYRSNRMSSVRVASGGPELSFETVNGSISIRKGLAR